MAETSFLLSIAWNKINPIQMKFLLLFSIATFICASAISQEQPITLDRCLLQAEQQFPLLKQKSLYGTIADHNKSSIQSNFLPQATVNGQASWQSDVTQLPVKIPGINIPTTNKDMYKLTLDVNQLIFDAGTNKRLEELEKINLELNQQGVDVELYRLRIG